MLPAPRRRYLNSCAAKALFRAGDLEAAERMALRFTKDGDQPSNLTEMQAMWYEIEAGHAHLARREYGMVRPESLGPQTLESMLLPCCSMQCHEWQCGVRYWGGAGLVCILT